VASGSEGLTDSPAAQAREAAAEVVAPLISAGEGFPIHIGFSTTTGVLSRLIRWATGAPVSHCFLVYHCGVFGSEMVLEASGAGFRVMAWNKFERSNKLIAVYRLHRPDGDLRGGMTKLALRLGDAYDTLSLLGFLLRKLFHLRRVPFNDRKKLVCSEAIALYLQSVGVPVGRISVVTPRDLFELAERAGEVFERVETGRAFKKVRRRRK
jgi:hypothetical protein